MRILNTVLLAILLAATVTARQNTFSSALDDAEPTRYVPQPFDVLHYDADLDFSKAPQKVMTGVCHIRVNWIDDPAAGPFVFHLRGLSVDSVFYNGTRTEATAVGNLTSATYRFQVMPSPSTKIYDTVTITVYYSGTMTAEAGSPAWGGVTSSGGTLFSLGVGFQNNYVSTTQHWLPCYDLPADKATFHARFRIPGSMAVASVGLLTSGPEPGPDSTVFYEWQTHIPCATYLLTFAVDKFFRLGIAETPVPMEVWSRAADSALTRRTFSLLPRMVETYEKHFGDYPFEKVGYVNTPLGAMEHQTMISFPYWLSRSGDSVNSTVAHELAHQWFGDFVSPLDYRHAWLNESFAVFCETIWAEELEGYAGYMQAQESQMTQYIQTDAVKEGILPLYDFPRAKPSSNYPRTIYSKGAVVVGMLRYELGDSIFFAAIGDYLKRHAYATATTEDLRTVIEEHAGRSLQWFFDQWVYGKGWPEIAVDAASIPGSQSLQAARVTLRQTQNPNYGTFTNLPIELGFSHEDGSLTYRIVRLSDPQATFSLDSVPLFTAISVNHGPTLRTLMQLGQVSGVLSLLPDSGTVQFTVRPNPAANISVLTIEVKGPTDCNGVDYELYDTAGQRILLGSNNSCQFTIPIANFSSGAYVLRFKFQNLYYDVPVVITH